MNVASTELAPTSLNVSSRMLGAEPIPLFGDSGSDLTAFLSLVTGFLEKAVSTASNKDKSKGASSDLNKGTKNHNKEEPGPLLLPTFPVQELAAFVAKPPLAFEFTVASGTIKNDERPVQHPVIAPEPLAPSLVALTAAPADIAFALRLTPNGSGTKIAPPIVIPAAHPAVRNLDSVPNLEPVQTKLNPGADLGKSIPAPRPEGRVTADQPLKPELRAAAEPKAKRELPASHLNDRPVERNATALEVSVRPVDGIRATDTRVDRPSVAESDAPRVAAEPEIKVGSVPRPTRQISLKLSTDDSTRVNVDLTERAGKVQVAVRTSDQELAKSLQTDLGDLVGRLVSKGFKTEVWVPAAAHHAAAPSQPSHSDTGSGQPQHSNSGSGRERHGQRQNGSNHRQQARWTSQLEETLSANNARSESQ